MEAEVTVIGDREEQDNGSDVVATVGGSVAAVVAVAACLIVTASAKAALLPPQRPRDRVPVSSPKSSSTIFLFRRRPTSPRW